jgi:hypothetical protein
VSLALGCVKERKTGGSKMKIQKQSDKRLERFWGIRLPNREKLFERFKRVGLLPQDYKLNPLELVCVCSLMVEYKTIYDVYQSIDRLKNESIESKFGEAFFKQMKETTAEMEMAGMRAQARKLRKVGQGMASIQGEETWQTNWKREAIEKQVSAIKDEPFLPQKG